MDTLNFDEAKQSQLPLVEVLINMGYRYIPCDEVMKERRGDTSKFILKDTAFRKFSEINGYECNGQQYKFSEAEVMEVIDELENIPFEGLIDTSKKVYGMIMPTTGGKTIRVFCDGKYDSKSFKYIDFENIENNDFAVTVEFEATGKGPIRPDIVVFVNGIPFSIIENKKSSEPIEKALSQQNRNQQADYCPKLFVYPQLLIGANKIDLRYGTTGTPNKFYAKWKERELIEEEWKYRETFKQKIEQKTKEIISKKIDTEVYQKILANLKASKNYIQDLDRTVSEQDIATVGLLSKERLLDISKNYILYDAGIKKVLRYQQIFAIKKLMKRIEQRRIIETGEKREGGILWQTQGSGKSLTMVMFVKALIENPEIQNPRVLIVTDRRDLDRQIKGTFNDAGLKKNVIQAKSGEHLFNLIKEKNLSVITTLVQKFESASKHRANFVDKDENIFVLIDEAHRTQGGQANIEMNRTIPNACYIAFTGTPLLKNDTSVKKFGNFVDRYTIDDGLEDGIILPLIYEGRYVPIVQDKEEIDRQVARIFSDLTKEQIQKLQDGLRKEIIQDNPQRIAEIQYDIEQHYISNFQGSGLKAQLVAPSKYSAILFQKYFKLNEVVNTAIVISDENGIIEDENEHKKEVDEYLKEIKDNYQSLLSYEKDVIESFKNNEEGIEILIVVDKLLTGFDAPRNTVLYLTKELRDHNLLQAIARVNRLFDNDTLPKTAGYIIDYSENAKNLKSAMELFGNFDVDDVKSTLIDVDEKIQELETSYAILHDHFNGVRRDDEAYLQSLADEATRKEFYEALNSFMRNLSECMILQDFAVKFNDLDLYRNELKKFLNLRKTASVKYADDEYVDFQKYKYSLTKIIDKNIKAQEAEILTRQVSINDKELFNEILDEMGSDKSRAEAITSQIQKTANEKMGEDPVFYKKFSQKIEKLIEDMRQNKLSDIEALKAANQLSKEILNKEDKEIPEMIRLEEGADIFYRNLGEEFSERKLDNEMIMQITLDIVKILKQESVVDWQINSESKRVISNEIDDYLYDVVKKQMGIELTYEDMKVIVEMVMNLAQNNYQIF